MPQSIPALIFGPGLPPAGARGTLAISILGVEVSIGERAQRASLSRITLREVGFDKPGLEIAWQDQDGAWAAHLLDPELANRLLTESELAGSDQALRLLKANRKMAVGRSIGRTLVASLLVLPVLLLVAFMSGASTIAGWIAERVPLDQEMAVGRQVFAGLHGGLKLKDDGPAHEAVQAIITTLTRNSRYRYEVHVVDDDTLNAFAIPGGIIVVHTGLIAATTRAEELAGVLAHEVQHVELRHSLRGVIKDMGLRGLWAFVTGDLGATLAGQGAIELTSLRFSRDDEHEADFRGLDAMAAARIDPAGMPAFFKIMQRQAGGGPPALLSTHPLSEDRERELQQRLATLGRVEFDPLPYPHWPPK